MAYPYDADISQQAHLTSHPTEEVCHIITGTAQMICELRQYATYPKQDETKFYSPSIRDMLKSSSSANGCYRVLHQTWILV
jgi:hypothetical protein